jgi:hypothetical protein
MYFQNFQIFPYTIHLNCNFNYLIEVKKAQKSFSLQEILYFIIIDALEQEICLKFQIDEPPP